MSKDFINKSKFGFNGYKNHQQKETNLEEVKEQEVLNTINEEVELKEQDNSSTVEVDEDTKKQEKIDKANSIFLNEDTTEWKHGTVSCFSKLNVRKEPDKNSEIIEKINTRDMVRFKDSNKIDWYEVVILSEEKDEKGNPIEKKGYCMCEYIREC